MDTKPNATDAEIEALRSVARDKSRPDAERLRAAFQLGRRGIIEGEPSPEVEFGRNFTPGRPDASAALLRRETLADAIARIDRWLVSLRKDLRKIKDIVDAQAAKGEPFDFEAREKEADDEPDDA